MTRKEWEAAGCGRHTWFGDHENPNTDRAYEPNWNMPRYWPFLAYGHRFGPDSHRATLTA